MIDIFAPEGSLKMFLNSYSNIAVLVGIFGVWGFTIFYRVFCNWKKTEAGRSVARFTFWLSCVFTLVVLSRWFGTEYPGRYILNAVVYTGAAWSAIALSLTAVRAWWKGEPVFMGIAPKPREAGGMPWYRAFLPARRHADAPEVVDTRPVLVITDAEHKGLESYSEPQ